SISSGASPHSDLHSFPTRRSSDLSRSILSFPRHEYFRRILCNLLGTWVEEKKIPKDMGLLKNYVKNICYYNAKRYFNLQRSEEHTSELQSRFDLVCRLLLEKTKT